MACKFDENWEDWGDKGEENPTLSSGWDGSNIVWKQECVYWYHLIQLRELYNQVWDECNKYGMELKLPTGRNKYGEPGHREEIEQLATIEGFFSIKMTGGASPQFDQTRFIITDGTINDRIPAPNPDYEYAANDYGPWIVYLKSECYGCGGWELDRSGDHYPRYRCCYGNSCGDMDPLYWKSQNYVGRTTEGGICNFGREWGEDYMDMVDHCIGLSIPKTQCVCDSWPPCDEERNECCQVDLAWHYSNFFDTLGPSGVSYGNPDCNANAEDCPQNYEKRGVKWIGSHEPLSGYKGYVTQVIKAKHLKDIWDAIKPALTGKHRMGQDWYYCQDRNDKKWGKDDSVDWETFRYRFEKCQKCDAPPVASRSICACEMNDLAYVLNKMLNNTCTCVGISEEFSGQNIWRIVAKDTPSIDECSCPPCLFDVWSFSVYHSVFGYGGFECKNSEVSDNRYLTYTIDCSAGFKGGQCGGGTTPSSINIVTEIDKYTGLSCTRGLPPNGYSCAGGSDCNETCSETKKSYNCTARPEDCAGKDEEGNAITSITSSYTLSETNTIEAAVGRAEGLLNRFNANSLPGPNTSGEVKVQSGGQALLAWSPGASPYASRQTDRGAAVLSKSIIKLRAATKYKIFTYDQSGQTTGEQEFTGVKNQVITLDPPSIDGSKFFMIVGAGGQCPSIYVNSEVSSTNRLTTKTLRVAPPPADGDEPEDQPCTSFILGPDCKRYTNSSNVYTEEFGFKYTISDESGYSENDTSVFKQTTTRNSVACFNDTQTITNSYEGSGTYTSPHVEYGTGKTYTVTNTWTDSCVNGVGGHSSTWSGYPDPKLNTTYKSSYTNGCPYIGPPTADCPLDATCGSDSNSLDFNNSWPPSRDCSYTTYLKGNTTCSSYSTTNGNVVSSGGTITAYVEKFDCDAVTKNSTAYSITSSITTYSGVVKDSFKDGDEETPPNYETKSWNEQDGLCAWKILATNGTMNEKTADITIELSLNEDPDKDYNVKAQMVIETNVTSNNCSYRYYDSYVQYFTMKGDGVQQFGKYLTASDGETKCMIHNSAVAYEA